LDLRRWRYMPDVSFSKCLNIELLATFHEENLIMSLS
jgi:hypothetical protein